MTSSSFEPDASVQVLPTGAKIRQGSRSEIGRLLWGAETIDELGRREKVPMHHPELPRNHGRVRRVANAQREVEALLDEVDVAICADEVHLYVRVQPQVLGEDRSERRERCGGRQAEQSLRRGLELGDGQLRLLELSDDANAVLVVDAPHVREAQLPGRALKQAGADALLELGELPADRGLRHPKTRRRRREASALNHPRENEDLAQVNAHRRVRHTVQYTDGCVIVPKRSGRTSVSGRAGGAP